jgi:hypothetical protein
MRICKIAIGNELPGLDKLDNIQMFVDPAIVHDNETKFGAGKGCITSNK